jgi:hypothetical protein
VTRPSGSSRTFAENGVLSGTGGPNDHRGGPATVHVPVTIRIAPREARVRRHACATLVVGGDPFFHVSVYTDAGRSWRPEIGR